MAIKEFAINNETRDALRVKKSEFSGQKVKFVLDSKFQRHLVPCPFSLASRPNNLDFGIFLGQIIA